MNIYNFDKFYKTVILVLAFILSAPVFSSENDNTTVDKEKACGEVSVFLTPPKVKYIYPALINKIDDDNAKKNRHSFRLPVGKHVIYLHELINDPFLKKRKTGRRQAKAIEIDIQPDTTYHLGAKFIRQKIYKIFNEEYWEPIIWQTTKNACQL